MFLDGIMVDYSYVECSSSCIKALLKFKEDYPKHRTQEIEYVYLLGCFKTFFA